MSKKDSKKSKSSSKATESSKAARKALKEGVAKPVIEISEHALEGEKPEWCAQLDALREADIAQGMTKEAALRVQRAQRVRLLKKGKELPAHGGLNELQEPEVVEPVIASDTEADEQPELPLNDDLDNLIAGMSKKQRKAFLKESAAAAAQAEAELAAAQQRAEEDRVAKAAEIAAATAPAEPERELTKKERKALKKAQAAESATPTVDQIGNGPDISHTSEDVPELPKTDPAASAGITTGTRRDNSLIALQRAQELANAGGKKQKVVMPRRYKTKNYGNKLITTYTAKDPNLVLSYKADSDTFNEETNDFTVTIVVNPSN